MARFMAILFKLKEMYQVHVFYNPSFFSLYLTSSRTDGYPGGDAELELVDRVVPFSEGIISSVMPRKKSWRNISNQSGGEKALSPLALVFALRLQGKGDS